MEKKRPGVGRCKCAFWFAVFHDIFGLFILLTGVFWQVFFHDFLIYAGAVIIFLSLIWWIFWYTGNIEVPPEELEDDIAQYRRTKGISGVMRKVSSSLSNGLRSSFRRNGRTNMRDSQASRTSRADQPISIVMGAYLNTQPSEMTNHLNRDPLVI
nr:transmembrane protein 238-like [Misgurnus anguillicaudatus]